MSDSIVDMACLQHTSGKVRDRVIQLIRVKTKRDGVLEYAVAAATEWEQDLLFEGLPHLTSGAGIDVEGTAKKVLKEKVRLLRLVERDYFGSSLNWYRKFILFPWYRAERNDFKRFGAIVDTL